MTSLQDRLGNRMLQRLAKRLRDKYGEQVKVTQDNLILIIEDANPDGELYIELIAHEGRIVDQNVHEFGQGWDSVEEALNILVQDYISWIL